MAATQFDVFVSYNNRHKPAVLLRERLHDAALR
jgi:hypothetical protein